jgi:hypothetical protein
MHPFHEALQVGFCYCANISRNYMKLWRKLEAQLIDRFRCRRLIIMSSSNQISCLFHHHVLNLVLFHVIVQAKVNCLSKLHCFYYLFTSNHIVLPAECLKYYFSALIAYTCWCAVELYANKRTCMLNVCWQSLLVWQKVFLWNWIVCLIISRYVSAVSVNRIQIGG